MSSYSRTSNRRTFFRKSISLDSVMIPEKQEQMEQRKKAIYRRAKLRRSAPCCVGKSFALSSASSQSSESLQSWESKKQARPSLDRDNSIPKVISCAPIGRPTVSRWDSGNAKSQSNTSRLPSRQPSPKIHNGSRTGRIVRNKGPPRMPVKQASLDQSPRSKSDGGACPRAA